MQQEEMILKDKSARGTNLPIHNSESVKLNDMATKILKLYYMCSCKC